MARTPEQLLDRVMAHLPAAFAPLRPLIASICGALGLVEQTGDAMVASVTIAGAEGAWLTLLAAGYGVYRADNESDESVRDRLRNVEDMLTVQALEAAADALLPSGSSELIEHWAAPHMAIDIDAACDVTCIYDQFNAFTLIVPENHPTAVYTAIIAEIERSRAAGVRWFLVVEDP